MLKTTFLTGEYPPMEGGIADYTAHLIRHLAPLEVESSVLIGQRWQQTNQEVSDESIFETTPLAVTGRQPQPHVFPSIPAWNWRCWPAVTHFLKTHRPNVLHIQYQAAAFELGGWINWLPWYLRLRRFNTRVVTTFHDLRVPYILPKAGPLRWKSMLALARHSDGIICTNREDLQTLQQALKIDQVIDFDPTTAQASLRSSNPSPLLTLIPLGSNVEPSPSSDFDRTAWRRRYRAGDQTFLLAYFGFLNESKGGEELIEALALLRQQGLDAKLLLIGGDVGHADPTNLAYAQRVQALIEQHHLTEVVHRTGYINLSDISANLLAADVVVMPYRDGVSFRRTTLIAALRHGRPVVSTIPADPGLIPEIRPGENMLLAHPQDAFALAEKIAPLADDARLRQTLATGAEALGYLFEWHKIAQETAALYRQVTRRDESKSI
ncbi:MAG: glycosyltransferase family 4 protein [Anaerolineae bacterium]|nr:glycosyltransferase family 4 protein [Anaerolineae bacterium]